MKRFMIGAASLLASREVLGLGVGFVWTGGWGKSDQGKEIKDRFKEGHPPSGGAEPAVGLGIMCQFGDPARRGDPILGLRFSS